MRFRIILILLLCLKFEISRSQTKKNLPLGGWETVSARYDLNARWYLFAEVQSRSYKVADDFFYHESKGGVGYNLNKSVSFFVGSGLYRTYADDGNFEEPVKASEFRIWQQINVTNNISRLKIEHRYRIEQRFFNVGDPTYRNRFRYRLSAIVPLNHKKLVPKTAFITVNDEIFLNNRQPNFERNRIFLGAGYEFDEIFTLQMGYLRQYDYFPLSISTRRNFLQTSLIMNFNSGKNDQERHPGIID